MAPSPTGFLHIGGVRTFLFNWLFARGRGGECLLRIENTDTSREVAESVEQIQRSLQWLGIDWDGPVTFQLDAMPRARELADRLVAEGKAYEDEGAIRFRMPDEGVTGWEDAVRGWIEFPNEKLEDVVIVRSDGRPTYNFASPVEDMDDRDHARDPRQRPRLEHAQADPDPARARRTSCPSTRTCRTCSATTARSSRSATAPSRSTSSASAGYLPEALMNFLALLGWSYDDHTTVMTPQELIERFSLERVGSSPATFDYEKLEWLNGVHLRALSDEEYGDRLVTYPARAGHRLA